MYRQIGVIFLLALGLASADPIDRLYLARYEDIDHTPAAAGEEYLLPGTTVPRRYTVSLTTNIHASLFEFTGEVVIDLMAVEETETIVLHHRRLEIEDVELFNSTDALDLADQPWSYVSDTEFLTIRTAGEKLVPNEMYQLKIKYSGVLRGNGNDYAGFYRSYYTHPVSGDRVFYATTQFESTDARHAFPCYDEPGLKAIFKISITHHNSYNAVSNMPVLGISTEIDDMITTSFDETPAMSTYLIAFIVSDFTQNLLPGGEFDVKHSVYAPAHLISETGFALEASKLILDNLASVLSTDYSLPKMDQFGIDQFSAGAMENWGLVTYRTSRLHYNDQATYTQKRGITTIIAHEYAHQWFGDLVSPEWWTYIWLNEGFATLFEHYSPQQTYPEFRTMEFFVTDVIQSVFQSDASDNMRPMTHPAHSPTEIQSLFDNIAYDKSGSVLRMMMYAFTERVFLAGLSIYFDNRKYQSANEDQFFDGVQEAVGSSLPAGVTFNDVMKTWTSQPGFPLVDVTYASGQFKLTQSRYLTNSLTDSNGYKWWVPVNYITKSEAEAATNTGTGAEFWIKPTEETSTIDIPEGRVAPTTGEWYLFNKGVTGYYRVKYPESNYNALIAELTSNSETKISNVNRAQLIDDSFNLARTGRLKYEIPLKMLQYIKNERDYFPIYSTRTALSYINNLIYATTAHDRLLMLIRDSVGPTFLEFGIAEKAGDEYYDVMARQALIDLACGAFHKECLEMATEALKKHIDGTTLVSTYLQTTIFSTGMRGADRALLDNVVEKFEAGEESWLSYFSMVIDTELIDVLLEYAMSKESTSADLSNVQRRDILITIGLNTRYGFEAVLNLMDARPTDIRELLHEADSGVGDIMEYNMVLLITRLTARSFSDAYITKLRSIAAKLLLSDGNQATVNTAFTAAEANKKYYDTYGGEIDTVIKGIYGITDSGASTIAISSLLIVISGLFTYFHIM